MRRHQSEQASNCNVLLQYTSVIMYATCNGLRPSLTVKKVYLSAAADNIFFHGNASLLYYASLGSFKKKERKRN